jgi:hypothetical protein
MSNEEKIADLEKRLERLEVSITVMRVLMVTTIAAIVVIELGYL